MTLPAQAVVVYWRSGAFHLGRIDRGEVGYTALPALGTFKERTPAKALADDINRRLKVAQSEVDDLERECLPHGPVPKLDEPPEGELTA